MPEWLRSGLCRARIVVTVVAIMAVGAFVSTLFHLIASGIALVRGPDSGGRPVATSVASPASPPPARSAGQVPSSRSAEEPPAASPGERPSLGSASARERAPSALDARPQASAPPPAPPAQRRVGLVDSLAQ